MHTRYFLIGALFMAGCTTVGSLSHQGSLILKTHIFGGSYGAQAAVFPYSQADIHHLNIRLFTYNGAEHDLGIQKTLLNSQLGNPVAFANLKTNMTYRIKVSAYADASGSVLISTEDASCSTDVSLTNDDRPTLSTLVVRLIDKPFNGQATASTIAITPGGYATPGPEFMEFPLQGIVTTIAGIGGSGGNTDSTASNARFSLPSGITADNQGNLYVADLANHRFRKITSAGVVSTLAGSSQGNLDGTGAGAKFDSPYDIKRNPITGDFYVVSYWNPSVRIITPSGVTSTFVGGTVSGWQDGVGSLARFDRPTGLAFDSSGNLYVADFYNSRIRKVTPAGVVTTFAGDGNLGHVEGTGTSATLYNPRSLAVDKDGNVYITEIYHSCVQKISPDGVVKDFAGLYNIPGYSDGTGTAARFWSPNGVACDAQGNVYVLESGNGSLRKITPSGVVTTLLGGNGTGFVDGTGAIVRFGSPQGLTFDGNGVLYLTDGNCVRSIK